jgi:hypothetical protein
MNFAGYGIDSKTLRLGDLAGENPNPENRYFPQRRKGAKDKQNYKFEYRNPKFETNPNEKPIIHRRDAEDAE